MKKGVLAIFLIFFITDRFSVPISVGAEKPENTAYVDWQKGFLTATGQSSVSFSNGRPVDHITGAVISINKARKNTYDLAREDAVLNISRTLRNLRIDSGTYFYDLLERSADARISLSKIINHNLTYRYFPVDFDTSGCEVKVSFGSIIDSIHYDFPEMDFPRRAYIPISTDYSGLIIDCRGMDIDPMIFPSVFSEDGLEIYGRHFIKSNYAVKGGMAAYCFDDTQAQLDERAGSRPYFTAAIKSIHNSPVLSEKDTRRILSSKITIDNLKKCRIILIIDR